ncbi:hypothetical protein EDD85DRAFT_743708, partial [Armillaria nabsnona]
TNSKNVLKHLTTSLRTMEESGYIGIRDRDILQSMVASYRGRKQVSTINWVKKHSGHHENNKANSLAEEGAWLEGFEDVNLEIDPPLRLTGAALAKMSQNQAYKALRERENKVSTQRRSTAENIKRAQQGAIASFGVKPNEAMLWKSLKHRDIDRNTTYLLWMTMHDAYRIGAKWLNFGPQYHERGYCKHCNSCIEDMDHIMTSCKTPGQKEVWDLTKKI